MRSLRRDLVLGAGLIAFLFVAVWASFLVTSQAVNRLLRQDAETEGEAWARYLAANVRDLREIVAGARPSADSMAFFEKAQKVGDVFLYKIFAPDGRLRLSSDKLDEVDRLPNPSRSHNPEVAEVVLAGETEVEVEEGTSADRPAFYAEAYVPAVEKGNIIGIVEVYVDQSAKREAFRAKIAGVALSLAGNHCSLLRTSSTRFLLAHAPEADRRLARRLPGEA